MPAVQANQCWFLSTPDTRPELVVRRTGAIGDTLCATCVAIKLNELGYQVRWQCHPDMHAMIRRVPSVSSVEEPTRIQPHVDLDGAYESHPARKRVSFQDIFVTKAGDQLTQRRILLGAATNCAPVLTVGVKEFDKAVLRIAPYPRPWIAFAARSNSHANRTIPDVLLSAVAQATKGTCFWIANHANAPQHFFDLNLRSIDAVAVALSAMDLFVGPDSGPMHIAAALRIPVIALEQASSPDLHLSDQRDFQVVRRPDLTCLNCQHVICPLPVDKSQPPCTRLDVSLLANAINARLAAQIKPDSVSCVITVVKPPAERLNRCIAAVLDQVDEVVITKAAGSVFPAGATRHAKVRYVSSRFSDFGYGQNMNHGMRHTNGNWVLQLNDDCFLDPGAVAHLLEVGKRDSKIAMVGHLLRYPDGRICHGGKIRTPGMRGWHLMDNRRRVPTLKQPAQMENITGTSVLVRRSAFYAVNGFDEDFHCYAEDDDLALRMRLAGHQIWYTPHATATHMEAQTTLGLGIGPMVQHANATFEKKWAWWWSENLNKVPDFK